MRHTVTSRPSFARGIVGAALAAAVALGCPAKPPAPAPAPQPDSAAVARARADSVRAAAQRDSVAAAARDSAAARARADSLAQQSAAQARADSVHAQVQRDTVVAPPLTASGLDSAGDAALAAPLHFDFNRSDLLAADGPLMDRKLDLLRANPRLTIEIAGNCDDRGSAEYNLALGERRAATAKRWLVAHGIADERISVVSYGEERPLDRAETEAAWAANRRDDFRVTRGAR